MSKYPYIVNKNGVWYLAGTDVPEDADFVIDNKVVGKVNGDVIEITDKDIIEETLKDMPKYTKTEINRMSTADLKKLAKENGIDDGLSGAEIKKVLIKKFGL